MADVEHLKMIQAILTRLAGNSFFLKGWTVTLAAGLSAFATADADATFAWIAVAVVGLFACLDARYLALERKYRNLYDIARQAAVVDWNLSAGKVRAADFISAFISWSVLPLHGAVAVGAFLVATLN